MTLNKIFGKLKQNNKKEYMQFQFCLTLAILLISSYLLMLFSPLIQKTLPVGGDTRKQIYMIFGIAAVGCTMFIIYAASLFLRYKSREIGVFLALGAEKGRLSKALFVEIGRMTAICSLVGIVIGGMISYLIGILFEKLSGTANSFHFSITVEGISYTLVYCVLTAVLIGIMSVVFMKRSNIIDIINEQRKQEPIKKVVTRRYLIEGLLCIGVGLFVGFCVPSIVIYVWKHWLGSWTNLFYLLVVIGLYRVMVYSIATHKRGKHPQKYYNNMILYGMLKFQGGSIVRNMLVISLLIMGGLFAVFYVPLSLGGIQHTLTQYEDDYSYWYPMNAEEVSRSEVEQLAEKHGITLKEYREAEWVQVKGSGVDRSDVDENGNLMENYYEDFALYECISISEYEKLTGKKLEIENGHYKLIISIDSIENVFHRFDNMDQLFVESSSSYQPMKYDGNEVYSSLIVNRGFSEDSRFIVSDQDYAELKKGLSDSSIVKQVLFNSEGKEEGEIAFAKELYREYALRASENMKIPALYDPYAIQRSGDTDEYKSYVSFDPEHSEKDTDWQYNPIFVKLVSKQFVLTYSIFSMMLMYIAVICLVSVGIISYTRSQSIGYRNKQVFSDIEKLGADHSDLARLLKGQIKKIYVLPTIVSSILILAFELLLLWQNDGALQIYEAKIMGTAILITICVSLFQYLLYRVSVKKVSGMLGFYPTAHPDRAGLNV